MRRKLAGLLLVMLLAGCRPAGEAGKIIDREAPSPPAPPVAAPPVPGSPAPGPSQPSPPPAPPLVAPSLPGTPSTPLPVPGLPVFRENELALGRETREWIERMHRTPGTHILREGPYQHVLIALGERPTGGFRVELEAVTEFPDYILVKAVEIAPGPGDMVIQVLTYPYLLLSIETRKDVRASVILTAGAKGSGQEQHR